jgi:hypothetical protein
VQQQDEQQLSAASGAEIEGPAVDDDLQRTEDA